MNSNHRVCHMVKTDDEEFEFFLKQCQKRRGQIITMVLPGGPADKAGLKEGDRLIEINGENIEKKAHYQLVDLIQEYTPSNEITFTVVSEKDDVTVADDALQNMNGNTQHSASRPRLCKVKKKKKTFGFELATKGDRHNSSSFIHYIKVVQKDSGASKSGLRVGDRVIEINNKNIENLNHEEIVSGIKKSGKKVVLLVADEWTYKKFTTEKTEIKPKHAYRSVSVLPSNKSTSVAKENVKNTSKTPRGSKDSKTSLKSNKSASKLSSPPKSLRTFSTEPVRTFTPTTSDCENARVIHVIKSANEELDFVLERHKNEANADRPDEGSVRSRKALALGVLVRNLKIGKLGFRNGLMEEDLIISVNGKIALTKTVEEILEIINSKSNHILFIVLGPAALEKAKASGLASTFEDINMKYYKKPRTLKVRRTNKGGFGFYLKTEKTTQKHVFDGIEKDSPAYRSNMKNGDFLLRIGSVSVTDMQHEECVDRIKELTSDEVSLTVSDRETVDALYNLDFQLTTEFFDQWPNPPQVDDPEYQQFDKLFCQKGSFREEKVVPEISHSPQSAQTRSCFLKRVDGIFGFFLNSGSKHVLTEIEKDGAADRGGLLEYDRIIEINGSNVENESHAEVIERIRESGDEMYLLVSRGGKSRSSSSSSSSSESIIDLIKDHPVNYSLPRYCLLKKAESGFGFQLKYQESNHRKAHILTEVDENGTAYIAGVREGDVLIAINDINIQKRTREDVDSMLIESGSGLSLLVIDEQSEMYYRSKDVEITSAMAVATMMIETQYRNNSSSSSSDTDNLPRLIVPPHSTIEDIVSEDVFVDENDLAEQEKVLQEFDSVVNEIKNDLDKDMEEDLPSPKLLFPKERKDRLSSGLEDISEEPEDVIEILHEEYDSSSSSTSSSTSSSSSSSSSSLSSSSSNRPDNEVQIDNEEEQIHDALVPKISSENEISETNGRGIKTQDEVLLVDVKTDEIEISEIFGEENNTLEEVLLVDAKTDENEISEIFGEENNTLKEVLLVDAKTDEIEISEIFGEENNTLEEVLLVDAKTDENEISEIFGEENNTLKEVLLVDAKTDENEKIENEISETNGKEINTQEEVLLVDVKTDEKEKVKNENKEENKNIIERKDISDHTVEEILTNDVKEDNEKEEETLSRSSSSSESSTSSSQSSSGSENLDQMKTSDDSENPEALWNLIFHPDEDGDSGKVERLKTIENSENADDFAPPSPVVVVTVAPPKPPRRKPDADMEIQNPMVTDANLPSINVQPDSFKEAINLEKAAKSLKPVEKRNESITTFTVDPSGSHSPFIQRNSNIKIDHHEQTNTNPFNNISSNHQAKNESRDTHLANGVRVLENSKEISWSGDGIAMKIIESSSFD